MALTFSISLDILAESSLKKEENREGMEYRKCVLDLDKSSSLPTFHPLEVCGITRSLVSMSWCADI